MEPDWATVFPSFKRICNPSMRFYWEILTGPAKGRKGYTQTESQAWQAAADAWEE